MTYPNDQVGLAHVDRFMTMLGDRGVVTDQNDLSAYEMGPRAEAGKALCVVRPATTAEVSSVVSYCVDAGLHMIPQSGNTGLVGGSTPDASGRQVLISLERLTSPIEINPYNRTVVVGAGVRLSQLNAALESHGLFFPIDLGADPMVGGMVSTNTGGARFLKYGDVRSNLLGIEVVLADEQGSIVDMLSTPRKNNVGLDLKQVFVGTAGLFGIVTAAVLQVHPLPMQRTAAFLHPSSEHAVMRLFMEFERRVGDHLSAFEGISAEALEMAIRHVPNLRNPFLAQEQPGYSVLLELTRTWEPREVEQSLDHLLGEVLEEIWALPDSPLTNAVLANPEDAWRLRHSLTHALSDGGKVYAFDVGFAREIAMVFRRQAKDAVLSRHPHLLVCDFGHIGDGGLHFNIVEKNDADRHLSIEEVTELKDLVYDIVHQHKGSFSAEHGIGRNNDRWYRKYTDERTRKITADIRGIVGSRLVGPIDPA